MSFRLIVEFYAGDQFRKAYIEDDDILESIIKDKSIEIIGDTIPEWNFDSCATHLSKSGDMYLEMLNKDTYRDRVLYSSTFLKMSPPKQITLERVYFQKVEELEDEIREYLGLPNKKN